MSCTLLLVPRVRIVASLIVSRPGGVRGKRGWRWHAEADRAGALVAVVDAVAHLDAHLAAVVEAVQPAQRVRSRRRRCSRWARRVVQVVRVQPGDHHRRVGAGLGGAAAQPRQAVVHAVVVVQIEDRRVQLVRVPMPQRKLTAAPSFVDEVAVVVGGVAHRLSAPPRSRRSSLKSPVKREAVVAGGEVDLAASRKACLDTWLTTPPVELRPNSIDAEPAAARRVRS